MPDTISSDGPEATARIQRGHGEVAWAFVPVLKSPVFNRPPSHR
jgi:hypothetical protein